MSIGHAPLSFYRSTCLKRRELRRFFQRSVPMCSRASAEGRPDSEKSEDSFFSNSFLSLRIPGQNVGGNQRKRTKKVRLRCVLYALGRTTRQGDPNAITLSGRLRVTTLPAPMTTLFPMVTPGSKIAPPPIQTSLPITTGAVRVLQKENVPSSRTGPKRSRAEVG